MTPGAMCHPAKLLQSGGTGFGTVRAIAGHVAALLDPAPLGATDSLRDMRKLLKDKRGAVQTEYVVLVGTIGLAFVFAMITVGPKLVKDFERARNITASPIP
jgi:Flp pilus assembly pilin Flp